ncbi:MAG: hypothetical protein ACLR6B_08465 [Blautia sp.]
MRITEKEAEQVKEQLEKWKELLKTSGKNRLGCLSAGRSPSAGDLHSEPEKNKSVPAAPGRGGRRENT